MVVPVGTVGGSGSFASTIKLDPTNAPILAGTTLLEPSDSSVSRQSIRSSARLSSLTYRWATGSEASRLKRCQCCIENVEGEHPEGQE